MDIPGFKLGRQYAEGPYCKGYNALNLSNHKTVNVQIFHPSLLGNADFVAQFREIADRLVGVNFGIMTATLQAELSNRSCYVITEYFPSPQQLASAETNLTRQQSLHLALQLAQTLDQLHQAGLVHGGIEYSALYFRDPERIALRPVIPQRALPVLRPAAIRSLEPRQKCYVAPEAIKAATPASDFYALGVLLYQLIFKQTPEDRYSTPTPDKWSFEGEHKDLEPFIRQLIKNDPAHRIQSLDQYNRALKRCGVHLPGSALSVAKASQARSRIKDTENPASGTTSKWIFIAAGLAMVAVAGAGLLNLSRETTQGPADNQEIIGSDSAKPEPEVAEQTATLAEAESAEALPDTDSLYQQTLTLKQRSEQELKARSIITTAERQLEAHKLFQPSGDNAYESYQTLADMLSAEDERVQRGFTRIAVACHEEAEKLLQGKRLDDAQETVDLGLSVKADYPPLLNLRMRINERRSTLERKQNTARLKLQKRNQQTKKQAARQQTAQQGLLEQKQKDLLIRLQEEETRARNAAELARRQEAERTKLMKIEALLRSANDHLKNDALSLVNVFSAHQEYEKLRNLDYTDPKIRQLQSALIDAYTMLTLRENSGEVYASAISALEQGVQLNPRERKKLQIRSQLSR